MASWHQLKAGLPPLPDKGGYVLVADGRNQMQTRITFGEDKAKAFEWFALHTKNQPKTNHYLYYNGRLVA